MNLVQIQEDLKGLPMQAIMGYAEGSNPQVPPYVALAELNRRKQIQQGGQPQGQMPQQTVADEVKQQAGIMALQQQQAQQAQQGLMQMLQGQGGAARPMSPSDVHTDRGFAKGGVVALAGGGEVEDEELPPYSMDKAALPYIMRMLRRLKGGMPEPTEEGTAAMRARAQRQTEDATGVRSVDMTQAPRLMDEKDRTPVPRPGVAALPQAAPAVTNPGRAAPAGVAALPGAKAAAPGASPVDPIMAKVMEFIGQKAPETNDADLYKRVMERNQMFGIKEPGGAQDARIAQLEKMMQDRQALYKKQQEGRGLQNLIRMGSAIATAPGGRQKGVALAAGAGEYGRLKDAQGKEDLAQADKEMLVAEKMAELRSLNEQKQDAYRAGNLQAFLQLETAEKKVKAELQKEQATMAQHLATSKQQADAARDAARINNEGRVAAARIGADARTAGAGSSGDKLYDAAIAKIENSPQMKALAKQLEMFGMADQKKAAQIAAQMEQIRKTLMKAQGYEYPLGSGSAAPAAAPAAGGWSIQKVN